VGLVAASDLATAADALSTFAATIADPAAGPQGLQAAVAAARTFAASAGNPGLPAPNLDLLSPSDGVPRPTDTSSDQGPDLAGSSALAVSLPLPAPGPAGPPGDVGPIGPSGPEGPGIDPARYLALEQSVAALEEYVMAVGFARFY